MLTKLILIFLTIGVAIVASVGLALTLENRNKTNNNSVEITNLTTTTSSHTDSITTLNTTTSSNTTTINNLGDSEYDAFIGSGKDYETIAEWAAATSGEDYNVFVFDKTQVLDAITLNSYYDNKKIYITFNKNSTITLAELFKITSNSTSLNINFNNSSISILGGTEKFLSTTNSTNLTIKNGNFEIVEDVVYYIFGSNDSNSTIKVYDCDITISSNQYITSVFIGETNNDEFKNINIINSSGVPYSTSVPYISMVGGIIQNITISNSTDSTGSYVFVVSPGGTIHCENINMDKGYVYLRNGEYSNIRGASQIWIDGAQASYNKVSGDLIAYTSTANCSITNSYLTSISNNSQTTRNFYSNCTFTAAISCSDSCSFVNCYFENNFTVVSGADINFSNCVFGGALTNSSSNTTFSGCKFLASFNINSNNAAIAGCYFATEGGGIDHTLGTNAFISIVDAAGETGDERINYNHNL